VAPPAAVAVAVAAWIFFRASVVVVTAFRDFAAALVHLVTLAGAPTVAFSVRLDVAISVTGLTTVTRTLSTATGTVTRDSAAAGAAAGVSAAAGAAARSRWRRVRELLRCVRLWHSRRRRERLADWVGARDIPTR
jgi:hypothetical protein